MTGARATEPSDAAAPGPLAQLAGSTVRYFVIGAVGRGIQLLSIPIFLRLLSPEEFGVQAIALLNEQLIMIVAGYAFTNALAKHYADARRDGGDTGRVVGTALAAVVAFGGIALVVWQLLAGPIAELTLSDAASSTAVTRLVGVSAVANLVVTVVTSVWQLDRRFAAYGVATIGQYAIAVGVGLALVGIADRGAEGVVAGWTVASVLVATAAAAAMLREQRLAVDAAVGRSLFAYGGPLVPAALLMLVLTTNDRYLLVNLDDLEVVGVYAAVITVVNAVNTGIITPFKRGLFPMMWQLRGDPDEIGFHRRTFTLYCAGQAWFTLALLVFGDLVMTVMSDDDAAFVDRAGALAIVYGGFALLNAYDFLSAGYFFEGRTHHYLVTVATCTVLAVGWNLALIPVWGIWAAAVSNPVSYLLFAAMSLWYGRRYFVVPYEWARIAGALAVASAVAVAALAARAAVGGRVGAVMAGALVGAYPLLVLYGGVLSRAERDAVARALGALRRRRSTGPAAELP